MVSVSFLRGSGKHKQGGRPDLSIEIDSQLRNSAGLEPASPLLSSPSGVKDTLIANYSIVGGSLSPAGVAVKRCRMNLISTLSRLGNTLWIQIVLDDDA